MSAEALAPGTKLARRYVIEKQIGDGGMAQVYRAEHEVIARPVAIKVLSSEFVRVGSVVVRFLQEARASSKVRHENVVEITDFGETEDGRPFMVMEFLEGEDLATTIYRERRIPWERARPMLLQVLAALQAAHDQRVVHRDVKPGNIYRISRMGNDDFIKVLDFGIAKVFRGAEDVAQSLTLDGQVLGTPAYMSPEQCTDAGVDARSDLYSVGCLAYQMLVGRTPFVSDNPLALMAQQIKDTAPPMRTFAPDLVVAPHVEAAIMKALEKRPERRHASAGEFAEALLSDVDPEQPGLLKSLRSMFRRR